MFTPKLVQAYNRMKAAGKKVEVVFVSSDKDQDAYDGSAEINIGFTRLVLGSYRWHWPTTVTPNFE